MKNILKYTLSALIVGGTLFSCSEDDADDLNYKNLEENAVHFEKSSVGVAEASPNMIQLVGFYSSTNHDSDVSANVTVEGNSADYELVDSDLSFNFPAGVYSDTIFIKLNDNFDIDGNRDVVFSIASVSNGASIGYPGEAANLSTFILSIIDDDCLFDAELFNGTPSGFDNYNGREFPSQVSFSLVETLETNGLVTGGIYEVTGLIGGQFADWEETVTTGGTFKIKLDNSDAQNPTVSIYSANDDIYGLGRTDFYAETTGSDGSKWGYFINASSSVTNSFSTCGGTLEFTYVVDVLDVNTGTLYEADATNILSIQF